MITLDRFLQKIDKTSDCWLWIASKTKNGYGCFWDGFKLVGAHRFSFEKFNGLIDKGLNVCHKCDVKNCVNPKHLFLATQKENLHDMHIKGRQRKVSTYKSGIEHCNAILSEKEVKSIRQLYSTNTYSWNQLANKFKTSKRTIGRAIKKETYQNVK